MGELADILEAWSAIVPVGKCLLGHSKFSVGRLVYQMSGVNTRDVFAKNTSKKCLL